MQRSADGTHRWVYTIFPTNAYASDAQMSLTAFEDFYFAACLADTGDPLENWKQASEETRRLADHVNGHSEVHITGAGTDIRLGVEGRNPRGRPARARGARPHAPVSSHAGPRDGGAVLGRGAGGAARGAGVLAHAGGDQDAA